MKRRLEVTEAGAAFFQLDDVVDMFMQATASPLLLATVIRLSKTLRRRAWAFLCNTGKWNMQWLQTFMRNLNDQSRFGYVEELSVPCMSPVFLGAYNAVYFCRILPTQWFDGQTLRALTLVAEKDAEFGWKESHFDFCRRVEFDFAAQAIALSLERRETERHRAEWTAQQLFL